MTHRNITALLHELYRRSEKHAPTSGFVNRLQECLEDNGLHDDRRVPTWLIEALEAVLHGQELRDIDIGRLDGDTSNFLDEVSAILPGWHHVDEGEWLEVTFTVLGMRLYITREGLNAERKTCHKYSIQRTKERTS